MSDTGQPLISHPPGPSVRRAAIILLEEYVPFERITFVLT